MHLHGHAKAGYYPTPPRVLDLLATYVRPARAHGIFLDPCAGDGRSARLARAWQLEPWGIELHRDRATHARAAFDRFLHSDAFAVTLTRPCLSALFLNPPYGDLLIGGGRHEPRWLSFFSSALLPRGLLCLIVQTATVATLAPWLARYYRDITWFRFPDPEYEEFHQSVVFARRRSSAYTSSGALHRLTQQARALPPILAPSTQPIDDLPPAPAPPLTFTTTWYDPEYLGPLAEQQAWTQPRLTALFTPQHRSAAGRPLLPPQPGHLAQLIMAGILNNELVRTRDSCYLLKGAATKRTRVAPPIVTDRETITRTVEFFHPTILAWELQPGERFGTLLHITTDAPTTGESESETETV